jgi:hypothetical protein
MMFGVIGIPIKKTFNLNATEFGVRRRGAHRVADPRSARDVDRSLRGCIVLFWPMLACVVLIC